MKRTKPLGVCGAKRQFHLLAVFFENILIRVDTANIWLGFGIGGLTMDEHINREEFKKSVEERYCKPCKAEGKDHNGCWCRACWVDDMLDEVDCFPTADVAPVVHGEWIHLGGDEWCCSACGFVIATEGSWDKPTKKYCEDCGAKMDGGDLDG